MARTVSIELIRIYLQAGEEVWNTPLAKTFIRAHNKLPKDEAYYTVINMPEGQGCGNCRFKLADFMCVRVLGRVEDGAWCMEYLPSRAVHHDAL